jgi:quinoprotein glucose dehydrogenase
MLLSPMIRCGLAVALYSLHGSLLPLCLCGDQPGTDAPLPPLIAPASDEAEQSIGAIQLPEGWEIRLFAAEPDVANVVALDVDNRGRVFVCESFRQNNGVTDNRHHDDQWLLADLASETVQDRIDYHRELLGNQAVTYTLQDDRIRRLVDSDGDGRADVSSVVANHFNKLEEGTGAGVLARGDTLYFTCIPKLWKLTDQDDDGLAEQRTAIWDGFGVRVAFRGHDLHGLLIGPDGRLYFSIGDRGYHVATDDGRMLADPASGAVFRCELDGTRLEVVARGLRNPQELAFNDLGDLFTVDNNSDSGDKARIVQILSGGDSGWRMHYQYLPDRGPFNREKIWQPFHDEQPAYLVPPIANFSDGPSGLAFYPGTGFGDRLKDRFLLADFRGTPRNSGIRAFSLEPDGAFYRLAAGDEQLIWSVLATDLAFTPDGALLVSDWVSGWDGVGKGRLYRITDPRYQQSPIVADVAALLSGDWADYQTEKLLTNLAHLDRRIRLESQWELARRNEVEPLLSIATDPAADTTARLHAIWGADQIARLAVPPVADTDTDTDKATRIAAALATLLEDPEPTLRAATAKVMGERSYAAALPKLRTLLTDPAPRVQYFTTLALAQLNDHESLPAVTALLEDNNNDDPVLRHAGIMFLSSVKDTSALVALGKHKSRPVRRAAVVALRRLRHRDVAEFLADPHDLVVVEAARAIHDVPIPIAMPALAESIDRVSGDKDFVRRVLNANLRLGSPVAAQRVAKYAIRNSAPTDMRIEALDVLANWASRDPRDRVLGDYRPLGDRDIAVATAALETQIDSLLTAEAAIRERAIEVAAKLGIRKISPQIASRVTDGELEFAQRAAALRALTRLDPVTALTMAKAIHINPANDLSRAALSVRAKLDRAGSISTFLEATTSRDVRTRQAAWNILANDESQAATTAIEAAVQQYLAGELSEEVHLNVLQAAKGKLNPTLQQQLDEHQQLLADTDPLGPWLPALAGGDPEKGRTLFFEKTSLSCVRCHKIGLSGGEVGPNLSKIAKEKDRKYLLESICLPDASIAKGFETILLADDAGQVHLGILAAETDQYVELIQPDGGKRRILNDEIVDRKIGRSAMPDDLVKQLTLAELRDLVAYLASRK